MPFLVCLFEDGVQAIPINWIEGGICKYPPYMSQIKINKAISSKEEPGENWITHKVLRTFGHPVEDYSEAVNKVKLAQRHSDLDSDDHMPAKNKRKIWAKKTERDEWVTDTEKPLIPPLPVPDFSATQAPRTPLKQQLSKPVKSPRKIEPKLTPDKDFKIEILKKLNSLMHKVRVIEVKVDDMSEKLNNLKEYSQSLEPADLDVFPLKSPEELSEFERTCEIDQNYIKKCVLALKTLGGSTLVEVVLKIMKKVITNNLAEKFSLLGRKKSSFKDLKLYKVICQTVREHLKGSTDKEIDNVIARWLVQAKLRMDRAKKTAFSVGNLEEEEEIVELKQEVSSQSG